MPTGGEPRCPHCGGGMSGPPAPVVLPTARPPVKCPICGGRGTVAFDFYADTGGRASSSSLPQSCRSCGGRGIV